MSRVDTPWYRRTVADQVWSEFGVRFDLPFGELEPSGDDGAVHREEEDQYTDTEDDEKRELQPEGRWKIVEQRFHGGPFLEQMFYHTLS